MTSFSKAVAKEDVGTSQLWKIGTSNNKSPSLVKAPPSFKSSKSSQGVSWFTASLALLALGSIGAAIYKVKKSLEKKRKEALALAPQVPKRVDTGDSAAGTPEKDGLLYGVRVIDFGSVIAGPSIGRVMSELGAEVIKVEPPEGDAYRESFRVFEKPREFGTNFDFINAGKYSVVLDIKTKQGKDGLKQLLKDADVLITNVRPGKLESVGLGYAELSKEFPHLIFAQLSAWGSEGADAGKAGFDIGAFWTGTGLSGLIHDESKRLYSSYAVGSGDLATAQALLNGIMMALSHRQATGVGRYVSTSLFHCGVWCTSPYLLQEQHDVPAVASSGNTEDLTPLYAQEKPRQDPLHTLYKTQDNEYVAVIGYRSSLYGATSPRREDPRTGSKELECFAMALGINVSKPLRPDEIYECACNKILTMTYAEVSHALDENNIVHRNCRYMQALWACVEPEDGHNKHLSSLVSPDEEVAFMANLEPSPPGVDDLKYLVQLPYSFSCSDSHYAKKRAPFKGENTTEIIQKGWFHRPDQWLVPKMSAEEFKAVQNKQVLAGMPLQDCIIVELVDFTATHVDLSISAATKMLLDEGGCRVLRVEPKNGGDPLKKENPELYEHFNAGKEIVPVGDLSLEGNEELQSLLSSRANVLVTNLTPAKLAHYALDSKSLAAHAPSLLVVQVQSYRTESGSYAELSHGCLGAMWAASGLCTLFSGRPPSDIPSPPKHLLELIASFYVSAAVSTGWFYRKRTGRGQTVKVYYDGIGHWMNMSFIAWLHKDPRKSEAIMLPSNKFYECHPSPTFTAHRTKDGIWVQLLGSNVVKDLPKTLRGVGASRLTWVRILWVLLSKVLPNSKEPSIIIKARPLFSLLNNLLCDRIGSLTYHEFVQMAHAHDLWYTPVRMPVQVLAYEQARACGVFETMGHGTTVRVTTPVRLFPPGN